MPEGIFFAGDYSPYLLNHQTVLQTTTKLKNFLKYLTTSKPQCLELFPLSPSNSSTCIGMFQELDDSGERLESKEAEAALPKGNRI